MNGIEQRNDLMLTASFANTLARIASRLDDASVCDETLLLELLALADRAEEALKRFTEGHGQACR